MKLSDYLQKYRIRGCDFADLIGVSRPTVSRIASGFNRPEWDTMLAILDKTNGKVKPNDFIG